MCKINSYPPATSLLMMNTGVVAGILAAYQILWKLLFPNHCTKYLIVEMVVKKHEMRRITHTHTHTNTSAQEGVLSTVTHASRSTRRAVSSRPYLEVRHFEDVGTAAWKVNGDTFHGLPSLHRNGDRGRG